MFGEAPGMQEQVYGRYMVGRAGVVLDNALEYLGFSTSDVHLGNVVLCRPTPKMANKEWRAAIECCSPQVDLAVQKYRDVTNIVAFGKWALYRFTGKQNLEAWAGAPLEVDGKSILATHHPFHSTLKKGWPDRPVLYIHLDRAFKLANGELGEWEWPETHIDPGQEMVEALERIRDAKEPVGFDVETQGVDPLSSTVMCLGLANTEIMVSAPWQAYYSKNEFVPDIESYKHGLAIKRLMMEILGDPEIGKVCQNGIHDLATAHALGIEVNNYSFDTMLAHTVVAQGRKHNLGWIACEEFHAPRWKEEKHTASNEKGAAKFANRLPEELRLYNAKDAWMTVILGMKLAERLDKEAGGWTVMNSYMANTKTALKMLLYGVQMDIGARKKHRPLIQSNRSKARREIKEIAEKFWPDTYKNFNPDSHKALSALFIDQMNVIPKKFSDKTGEPSWDEEALSNLLSDPNQMVSYVARALLRYRRWSNLLKYTEMPIDEHKLVRVTWKPSGAKTMRWSSSPNMQNIPPRMRNMFVGKSGGYIVKADYEQLELRIATLLSGAQKLLEVFEAGKDPHWLNATLMFGEQAATAALDRLQAGGKNANKAYKDMRDMAKMAAYQMMYGGAPTALWKRIIIDFPQITLARCQSIHHRWFDQNHEFTTFHRKLIEDATANKYVEAPFSGHRFYIFGGIEPSFIYNYPIQHSAADIINPTVQPIVDALNWKTESLMAQIHDELMLEGLDIDSMAKLLKTHMTVTKTYDGRTMEFPVSLKVGPNMRDTLEVKPNGKAGLEDVKDVLKRYDDFKEAKKVWEDLNR